MPDDDQKDTRAPRTVPIFNRRGQHVGDIDLLDLGWVLDETRLEARTGVRHDLYLLAPEDD